MSSPDDTETASGDPDARTGRFRRSLDGFGTRYDHYRYNHRLGRLLRYLTITVGTLVTIGGIIAIPYPGPGWAMVFFGLLILSKELVWAERTREWGMTKMRAFYANYVDESWTMKAALAVGTCAAVVASLWITGMLGTAVGWFGVDYDVLDSPLV